MSDATAPPAASTRTFLVTFTLVLGAVFALFVFDTFLAGVQRRAGASEAAARYREGTALMAAGRPAQAVEKFKAALAIERLDADYARGVADAARAAGRPADAVQVLGPLLEREPTNGAANLSMARALLAARDTDQAVSYYHRAIYGLWPGDATAARRAVRLELVDLLAGRGSRQELLAELLPLEDEENPDTALQRRRAHLFIAAGSPERAAQVFRQLLRRDRTDADALAGLGQAEAAQGNYGSAQTHLMAASRLRAGDAAIAAQLAQVDRVRDMDPTLRGLAPAERRRRSAMLLGAALVAADRCPAAPADSALPPLMDSARAELARPARAVGLAAAAEGMMDRAEQIWAMRAGCPEDGNADQRAAALVLDKLRE